MEVFRDHRIFRGWWKPHRPFDGAQGMLQAKGRVVTPAQAGAQVRKKIWIPVFTGMTMRGS